MGGVMASLFGGDSAQREALAAQADMAAKQERLALADRAKQDNQASLELARRPRAGQGRRLLQYFAGDLADKLGG